MRRLRLPADPWAAARLLPAVLAVLGLVAVACAVADVRAGPLSVVRSVATVVFLVLGTGWTFAGLLTTRSVAERSVVAAGTGTALTILVGQAMVVTGAWHPVGALLVAAVLAVPVLVRHALARETVTSAVSG